ncbi:MAG: hypothetical protein KDA37_06455 [Planctomycetales bacterium]|nr:hypothetical protein [Planctomycetales bacterium]
MGLMRFDVRCPERIADEKLSRVYIAAPDDLPYYGRAYFSEDKRLHVERRESASGALCVPWLLDEHGPWMISTTTLMERERPYQLEVELARGLVYQVRNQLASWELLGLVAPDDLKTLIAEATAAFSRAAVMQVDPPAAVSKALEALSLAAAASLRLAECYAEQALKFRCLGNAKLPTLLGVHLNKLPSTPAAEAAVGGAFTLLSTPCSWNDVEPTESKRQWGKIDQAIKLAQQNRQRVSLGPLLQFSEGGIPEWAYLFEGDVPMISSLMLSHVEACVERYRGRVNLWNIASRVNRSRVLEVSDEQRLQLVARAVRRVRELDPQTPVTVCFDQPWSEALAVEASDLAAIDFADALDRADLGIAGYGIEFNMAYTPRGATPRSPLAFSRMLDAWWTRLESPLLVLLTLPSSPEAPPECRTKIMAADSKVIDPKKIYSPESQAEWLRNYLPVMLAKNCVQVVVWNQLQDGGVGTIPGAGLLDAQGKPKPALGVLRSMRADYMG